jgi:hypothetical protein
MRRRFTFDDFSTRITARTSHTGIFNAGTQGNTLARKPLNKEATIKRFITVRIVLALGFGKSRRRKVLVVKTALLSQ